MVGHWCEGRGKRHNSFPTAYLARFVFPFAPNGSRTRKLRKHPIFFTSNMVRIKGLNLFSLSFPYTTNSWLLQGTLLSWCHLFPILCTPLEQQVPVMFLLWFSLLPTQNREKKFINTGIQHTRRYQCLFAMPWGMWLLEKKNPNIVNVSAKLPPSFLFLFLSFSSFRVTSGELSHFDACSKLNLERKMFYSQ